MTRRTKEEIEEDEQFTCSVKSCKTKVEEVYSYSSYHTKARLDEIVDLPFCEECFKKKEEEYQ